MSTFSRAASFAGPVVLGGLLLVEPLVVQQTAYAQDHAVLEEVVVTARKREESLQDTPISITAFSGVDLQRQHIDRLEGVAQATPNLVFNTGTFTSGTNASASVWIRGIGQVDFTLTSDPGVGVYLDGVYIATSVGSVLDLVDVERVEVLRGPQGTLFGRNTIGGAISVTSKQPDDELHGNFKVTTGRYDRADARGSINIPLTDTLFAKVAAATFNRDGFVDTPNAASSGKLGDMDREAFRGALRFVPNDRFEANLSGDFSRARENSAPHVRIGDFLGASLARNAALTDPSSPNFRPPPAPIPPPSFNDLHNILTGIPFVPFGTEPRWVTPPDIVPNPLFGQPTTGPDDLVDIERDNLVNPSFMDFSTETDVWGLSLSWSYDFDWASLKSISAYREMEASTAYDQDAVAVETVIGQLANRFDSDQFTQEVQLTGTAMNARLNWVMGLYHFEQTGLDLNDVEFTPVRILSGSKIDDRSTALFAQATFDVTDKLSITGGIRYTDETKKYILDDDCHVPPKGPATLVDGTMVTCTQLQSVINPKVVNPGFLTTINAPVFPIDPDPDARVCCLPLSDADGNLVGLLPGVNSGFQVIPRGTTERDFSDSTPHASIAYRWTEYLMTYFSYSEGFKSGGFVQRVFPPKTEVPSFNPETAQVFEVGLKWTGFENRVQVSAAGFHTQYEELHIQINDGIAPVTRNAGEAEINGFELELTARPAARWLIQAGVGYLDAFYTKLDPREDFAIDLLELTRDTELANAPEWSTNLGVQYEHDIPGFGGRLISRLDWSYRTETYNDALNFPILRQEPYHLVDLALTYVSPGEAWELSVFGKNVTDEDYMVSGSVNGLSHGRAAATLGRPAEWGLSFTYRFGS